MAAYNPVGRLHELAQHYRLGPPTIEYAHGMEGWHVTLAQELHNGERLNTEASAISKQRAKAQAAALLLPQLEHRAEVGLLRIPAAAAAGGELAWARRAAKAETLLQGGAANHKGQLQELLQVAASRGIPGWFSQPEYKLVGAVGPDHKRSFKVEVTVKTPWGPQIAAGQGPSKVLAEQAAATEALQHQEIQALRNSLLK